MTPQTHETPGFHVVLVSGNRSATSGEDRRSVEAALHAQLEIARRSFSPRKVLVVMHGGATGVDQIADRWAKRNGAVLVSCKAPWGHYRNAAGPLRNAFMVSRAPDVVLAFPKGPSPGTRGLIALAKAAGIPIIAEEI